MPQVVDLRPKKPIPKKGEIKPIEKTRRIKVKTKKPRPKNNTPAKIEWTALEFTKYKKDKQWFILPALIALVIIIVAILLKNFLLVVLAVLAIFVVYIYALKEPRKIKFSISGKGIQVDKRLYKLEDLRSFWIFYDPPEIKEISLRSKKMFMPYIKIPLGNQNPVEARKILLRFLPEKKHRESKIDEWTRKSRF